MGGRLNARVNVELASYKTGNNIKEKLRYNLIQLQTSFKICAYSDSWGRCIVSHSLTPFANHRTCRYAICSTRKYTS